LKEDIMPEIDHIDGEAQAIGAVNTLVFSGDRIIGYNTDGFGALNAIEQGRPVKGKHVVVLGAGGAAKAVIYEAHRRGANVTVVNRDAAKGLHLANRIGCHALPLDQFSQNLGCDILINCTPVANPIHEEAINSEALVMDIKTRPKETPFLTAAKYKGCHIIH